MKLYQTLSLSAGLAAGAAPARATPTVYAFKRRRAPFVLAAMALAAFAAGAGPVKATPVETDFGALTTPSSCGYAAGSGDEGLVCGSTATFSNNATTFTTTAFSGAPGTSTTAFLTFKPENPPYTTTPNNSFQESGLGENPSAPPSACDEISTAVSCEIAGHTSVAVVDGNSSDPISDVIIGSVQSGENYILWAGSSLSDLMEIATGTGTGCTGTTVGGVTQGVGPASDTCIISGFSDLVVAVQSGGTGDVLLTAVSQSPIVEPDEPNALLVLGAALLGLGVFRLRRNSSR